MLTCSRNHYGLGTSKGHPVLETKQWNVLLYTHEGIGAYLSCFSLYFKGKTETGASHLFDWVLKPFSSLHSIHPRNPSTLYRLYNLLSKWIGQPNHSSVNRSEYFSTEETVLFQLLKTQWFTSYMAGAVFTSRSLSLYNSWTVMEGQRVLTMSESKHSWSNPSHPWS